MKNKLLFTFIRQYVCQILPVSEQLSQHLLDCVCFLLCLRFLSLVVSVGVLGVGLTTAVQSRGRSARTTAVNYQLSGLLISLAQQKNQMNERGTRRG